MTVIRAIAHIAFLLLLGLVSHFSVEPGAREWHKTLQKSKLTPIPAVFFLLWAVSYVCLGTASYKLAASGAGSSFFALYLANLLCLNAWNVIFFQMRYIQAAAVLLVCLSIKTVFLIVQVEQVDASTAAWLLPYFAWLLFVAYLSMFMAIRNLSSV